MSEISGQHAAPGRTGTNPARPVFLNPFKVRLPVTAIVSLAHRISGMLLVLALPGCVYLLAASLAPDADPARWAAALHSVPGRLVTLVAVWSLAHHTAAGVRHLLFDAGYGTNYRKARTTAWAVHGIAIAAVLLTLAWMAWGAQP
ncbi:succinate dehydrogenase, cytochrome b556 subunit [Paracidovorax valerianellae]|uniref:Succinate dehydrogenase cytochrome b556 subunit n=1 Tax=Paracidovorax valerianellae TaxID=187868 RepID=A0A1G6YMY1_9BURK|nr:succinate dehydrogenase, cytochrome b556 subunit [Paracidovorax valerianellae]MDA8447388.1 succinate dehydrogenase, cytochrome b556 subunit [Paracidovorax valerianellae]SDD91682.1 succinate dehydrogenase subunit C [Paracidovorax valerianellae]